MLLMFSFKLNFVFVWMFLSVLLFSVVCLFSCCSCESVFKALGVLVMILIAFDTADGRNPHHIRNHGKPLFIGIYRGIIPGFLRS